MSHRAEQVIDLCADLIRANTNLRGNVYTHRTLSLSGDAMELDAVSVNYGEDAATEAHFTELGSDLQVAVICYASGPDEPSVLTTLLELRRQTHIALMADSDLGLPWVILARYGGAEAPTLQAAEEIVGELKTFWIVQYRMSVADPQN